MNLDEAVTIVTGASGGIGEAIALALAERRGRIIAVARRAGPLSEVADAVVAHGGEAVTVVGDVAEEDTARHAVDAALSRFGRIDMLVNAAGFGPPKPLVELTKDIWDATIESCLTGLYVMTRAVLPTMLAADAGRIVNVSSVAGKGAEANRTAYCAAKWGGPRFLTGTARRVGRHRRAAACAQTRPAWRRTGGSSPGIPSHRPFSNAC